MAATASSVIHRDKHPINNGTTATPVTQRRSLPPQQRKAVRSAALKDASGADAQGYDDDNAQTATPTTDDLDTPQTSKRPIPLRRSGNSGNTTTSQQRRGLPSWAASLASSALLGTIVVIVLYSLTYGIAFLSIGIYNRLAYGPTHTDYTHATLNGQASDIITSNANGTVYITIVQTQPNGTAKASIYTGPALDPAAWGNDLSSIVATASVAKNQIITVNLIGNINYFHLLFARPTMTLQLIPDKQAGYKVVPS